MTNESNSEFTALRDFAALNVIENVAGEHFVRITNGQLLNSAGTSRYRLCMKTKLTHLYILAIWLPVVLSGCKSLPTERYRPFDMEVDLIEANDTVVLQIVNPVACPLRVSISHPNESINQSIGDQKAIVLDSYDSAEVMMFILDWEEEWRSDFRGCLGFGVSRSNAGFLRSGKEIFREIRESQIPSMDAA